MIGHYCIFFLVGISLASNVAAVTGLKDVDVSEVAQLLATVQEHQEYVDTCQDYLGADLLNVKSCSALVLDLVDLNVAVANISAQAAILYADGVKIVVKFNTCALKLIIQEIKCLESVYESAKTLVGKVETEFVEAQSQIETLVTKIETDLSTCAASGLTSKQLDALMSKCKSKLA